MQANEAPIKPYEIPADDLQTIREALNFLTNADPSQAVGCRTVTTSILAAVTSIARAAYQSGRCDGLEQSKHLVDEAINNVFRPAEGGDES